MAIPTRTREALAALPPSISGIRAEYFFDPSDSNQFFWITDGGVYSGVGINLSALLKGPGFGYNAALTGATEQDGVDIEVTSDNTFLTGTDITYSSGRGSAILKLVGVASMASGGFEGIDLKIASAGAFAAAGDGVIGAKSVVTQSGHMADGNIYGGQFIAKFAAAGSLHMHAEAALIGLDAQGYVSSDGEARTVIGLNATIRSYALAGPAGSVHRAIQVIIDEAVKAEEVSAMCVWNMAGTVVDNVFNLVGGAFTNFVLFTDDGTPAQSTSVGAHEAGQHGWIKVKVGAATRYIPLADTVS